VFGAPVRGARREHGITFEIVEHSDYRNPTGQAPAHPNGTCHASTVA
jgi:hypothetical protein